MRIIVFGASGKVGQIVVDKLLEQKHEVVAFVHSRSPFDAHKNLHIIKGDVHDKQAVGSALAGSDIVISTLGSWGTPQKDILTTATKNIISASKQHTNIRFISVTGADARMMHDKLSLLHRMSHIILGFVASKILTDGEQHIALLEKSGLNWTVVRSPIMTTSGSADFMLDSKRPTPWATVHRRAVANAIVEQVQTNKWSRQAPFIHRG